MEIVYYVLFKFDGHCVDEIEAFHPDRIDEAEHDYNLLAEHGSEDYWLRKYTLSPDGTEWENIHTTMKSKD